ncbi:hypothetical protein [uncultured Tateyamaria sp.]|uniref:hypothetical protein n=1 Tax=uncultured Tateyamaria sp. TaxID=455651 RepID=UPI00260E9F72|nr:hypothetical protein [uncultured Tateyamaria sp.]
MGDASLRGTELKKMVKLSKKRAMSFAYCPAGSPQDDVFYIDRKKKPEVIGREARAESEGTKLGFGTVESSGRVMSLTCTRELPQMAKKLKKYLKLEKCPMNVIVLDADGNVLEEDVEDLPADPEMDADDEDVVEDAAPVESGDDDAERANALKTRAMALQDAIKGAPSAAQAPLAKGYKSAVVALKGGDLDTADATIGKLEQAIAKLGDGAETAAPPPPPPPSADPMAMKLQTAAANLGKRIEGLQDGDGKTRLGTAHAALLSQIEGGDFAKAAATAKALGEAITKVSAAQTKEAPASSEEAASPEPAPELAADPNASEDGQAWNAARARLEPAVMSLLERNMGDVSKMRAAWAFFTEKGDAGAFADGMKVVPGLEKLIAEGEAAEQTDAEKDIPADVVPFVRARLGWSKARTQLQSEMMKLQNAILAVCQGEEFAGMANDTKALFSYLESLDDRLEAALEALVVEPDGARRETLKGDARKVLAEYQSELQTPFFQDVDANNGFANVSVTGTATTALAEVDAVLAKAA